RAHEHAEETVIDLGRKLLDAGMARFRVGPDRALADAGVVDHRLDRAEPCARGLDRAQAGALLREVGMDRVQPVVAAAQRLQPFERGLIAVDGGDLVALRQQRLRHHAAEATGCAGQQHGAAWLGHRRSPSCFLSKREAYWPGSAIVEYAQPEIW